MLHLFFQVSASEEDGTLGDNNLPCLIKTCEAKSTFSNKTFPHKAQLLDLFPFLYKMHAQATPLVIFMSLPMKLGDIPRKILK